MNVRRMMYYDLIYPLLAYGIIAWGQSAKALTRWIFSLQKSVVWDTAGLKQLELCRDGFRQLKILTVYSLYFQETISYAKWKCNCAVSKQLHTYLTMIGIYII
jgi:hypothetical protein